MIRQGYATQDEMDAARAKVRRDQVHLNFETARILRIDDPAYFVRTGSGWFVVPGRSNTTVIAFDRIPSAGMRRLIGELMLMHPAAQPVRVEIIGLTTIDGRMAAATTVDLVPLRPVALSLPIDIDTPYLDLIVRVAIGAGSRTNDNAWVRMDDVRLVTSSAHESPGTTFQRDSLAPGRGTHRVQARA